MNAVTFKDVAFRWSSTFSLEEMNFTIQEGEFVGIIGPNGCGKTTLLKLMMGLLKPSSGTVQIFGSTPDSCKTIAYVPQTLDLDRDFPITVMEIVLSGRLKFLPWWGRYSEEDKRCALEALETVRLKEFTEHPFGKLSSGQAQRTLIARALASHPKFLVLDEPTASVDAQSAREIYALLHQLSGSMTIAMVTHDLNTALKDTNKIICVQKTALILKPEEVCKHFALGLYHAPLIPTVGH